MSCNCFSRSSLAAPSSVTSPVIGKREKEREREKKREKERGERMCVMEFSHRQDKTDQLILPFSFLMSAIPLVISFHFLKDHIKYNISQAYT